MSIVLPLELPPELPLEPLLALLVLLVLLPLEPQAAMASVAAARAPADIALRSLILLLFSPRRGRFSCAR
jgi:hypothetical protein